MSGANSARPPSAREDVAPPPSAVIARIPAETGRTANPARPSHLQGNMETGANRRANI